MERIFKNSTRRIKNNGISRIEKKAGIFLNFGFFDHSFNQVAVRHVPSIGIPEFPCL